MSSEHGQTSCTDSWTDGWLVVLGVAIAVWVPFVLTALAPESLTTDPSGERTALGKLQEGVISTVVGIPAGRPDTLVVRLTIVTWLVFGVAAFLSYISLASCSDQAWLGTPLGVCEVVVAGLLGHSLRDRTPERSQVKGADRLNLRALCQFAFTNA